MKQLSTGSHKSCLATRITKKKSDQFSMNANNNSILRTERANFKLFMFHVRRVIQQPAFRLEKLTNVLNAINSGVICVTGMLI